MTASGLQLADLNCDALARLIDTARDGVLVVDATHRCRYANPAATEIIGMPSAALAGYDLLALFLPHDRALIAAHFTPRPDVQVGRRSSVLVRPDGEEREIEYTTNYAAVDGQPLTVATLRDVTDTRRLVRWAATLAQIASSVALSSSLEATMRVLARSVVNATSTIACVIGTVESEPDRLRVVGAYGLPEGFGAALEASWNILPDSPSRQAVRERRTIEVADIRAFALDHDAYAPLHPIVQTANWGVAVCVPLIYRHRTVGVMTCAYPQSCAPREDEVAFLMALADQAAVGVENARLFAEAQDKAVLEERQRLARELHDSVSQALYGIALGARTARNLLDRDPGRLVEPLDYVLALAEMGLAEMRALIFELRPESLQTEGLVVALEKQAAALQARYSLPVQIDLCPEPDLPLPIKEAFYRIAQEALHNVVKHARASRVELRLTCAPEAITLDISDDGLGFNPDAVFPGHLGLQSMRERAARLGGSFTCTSAPGSGARITARIPTRFAAPD